MISRQRSLATGGVVRAAPLVADAHGVEGSSIHEIATLLDPRHTVTGAMNDEAREIAA
jgi:hypothetical protein